MNPSDLPEHGTTIDCINWKTVAGSLIHNQVPIGDIVPKTTVALQPQTLIIMDGANFQTSIQYGIRDKNSQVKKLCLIFRKQARRGDPKNSNISKTKELNYYYCPPYCRWKWKDIVSEVCPQLENSQSNNNTYADFVYGYSRFENRKYRGEVCSTKDCTPKMVTILQLLKHTFNMDADWVHAIYGETLASLDRAGNKYCCPGSSIACMIFTSSQEVSAEFWMQSKQLFAAKVCTFFRVYFFLAFLLFAFVAN